MTEQATGKKDWFRSIYTRENPSEALWGKVKDPYH